MQMQDANLPFTLLEKPTKIIKETIERKRIKLIQARNDEKGRNNVWFGLNSEMYSHQCEEKDNKKTKEKSVEGT